MAHCSDRTAIPRRCHEFGSRLDVLGIDRKPGDCRPVGTQKFNNLAIGEDIQNDTDRAFAHSLVVSKAAGRKTNKAAFRKWHEFHAYHSGRRTTNPGTRSNSLTFSVRTS